MNVRTPPAHLVERVAREEAERAQITMLQVLGVDRLRVCTKARNRAWVRLVVEEGFPVLGVAEAWGCDRNGIMRALAKAGYVAPPRAHAPTGCFAPCGRYELKATAA